MTVFLRILESRSKAPSLLATCASFRSGKPNELVYQVDPENFGAISGAPFSYWVSDGVRAIFKQLPSVEGDGRSVKVGVQTFDDTRFIRLSWEIASSLKNKKWFPFAKGGAWSPFYSDIFLFVNYEAEGIEMSEYKYMHRPREGRKHRACEFFFRPGITWPRRTQKFGPRMLPSGAIFADKGPVVFLDEDEKSNLGALLAIMNSQAFSALLELRLNAGDRTARSYEVGIIQETPLPKEYAATTKQLESLALESWSIKRAIDSTEETSHAFLLPLVLARKHGSCFPSTAEEDLARNQAKIDEIIFDLYGFLHTDRVAMLAQTLSPINSEDSMHISEDDEECEREESVDWESGILSWTMGVAFGRFDWRLATGERAAPPEPEPFDPLPTKSPGMLPDGEPPFHAHAGILVDDPGHPHDLVRIAERVLELVDMPVPGDLRRWLQLDFFPFHLQRYSKSRRKAPIYWPLATESGSYTLWLYYPSLTRQTLYAAVNDFVEPKIKQVSDETGQLRVQGSGRSRTDEKRLEALESLETELRDLRDQLLAIAPNYQPNYDDGVQITAAPLWPLFRHKPWQRLLRDTWGKLEKGDYDWAHLAGAYWPKRVREKCKTDKSLAIAHELEELYVEPPQKPPKARRGEVRGSEGE